MPSTPDFVLRHYDGIIVFHPLTDAGRDWLSLDDVSITWDGGIVVEPRYVDSFAAHLADEGMTVTV